MALVLNTNSYVTIAEADEYFVTRIDSAEWTDATTEVKEQALVTATQLVDDNAWIGFAVSSSQALAWPRKNAVYYSKRMGTQIRIDEVTTPNEVKVATFEQALHLVVNEDVLGGQIQTFESISVGSISLSDSNQDVKTIPKKPYTSTAHIQELLVRGGGRMGSLWWRAN